MNLHPIVAEDIEELVNSNLPWNDLKTKHILITGANGFLPSYMVYTLLSANSKYQLNLKVTALVRNKQKADIKFDALKNDTSFRINYQDVCDPIEDNNYDIIIHAASQASPKYYGTDPVGTLKPNIIGTNNLLALASQTKVDTFLYFSSSEVYGQIENDNKPIEEMTFGYLNPNLVRSCYAESKRMGETLCVSYFHQFKVPVKIVRPFHTYGPGMDLNDGRVYADFVKSIIENNDINLSSDGSAKRAFCYIKDGTLGFLTVLFTGNAGEAYNVGNQKEEYSIKELAQKLTLLYPEKNLLVKINQNKSNNYVSSKVNRNCPDTTKINALGWNATTSVEEGFTRTIKSYL